MHYHYPDATNSEMDRVSNRMDYVSFVCSKVSMFSLYVSWYGISGFIVLSAEALVLYRHALLHPYDTGGFSQTSS